MSPRRLAAGLAAAVLVAAPAAAYVRSTAEGTGIPLSWATPLVAYSVNPSQPHRAPSCAAGPDGDPALAAVHAAFGAWRTSCTSLELLDGGALDEIRTGLGGTLDNVVVFRQGWCSVHPEAKSDPCMSDPDVDCGGIYNCFEDHGADWSIVALTSVLYYPDTGRIVDADIEMNGWNGQGGSLSGREHGWYFTCEDPGGLPECTEYGQAGCFGVDLQNTLTHEVGHLLGLRHVCDVGSPADRGLPPCESTHAPITMHPLTFPGDVEKRSLHPDDVAGVCAIYPDGGSSGGCSSGGGAGLLGGLLAGVALARARRGARRR